MYWRLRWRGRNRLAGTSPPMASTRADLWLKRTEARISARSCEPAVVCPVRCRMIRCAPADYLVRSMLESCTRPLHFSIARHGQAECRYDARFQRRRLNHIGCPAQITENKLLLIVCSLKCLSRVHGTRGGGLQQNCEISLTPKHSMI